MTNDIWIGADAMTASFDDPLGPPPLAEAIDRHPLRVVPNACLIDVVTLMYETAAHHRIKMSLGESEAGDSLLGARASCVLVMQDEQLLGIFTERDLVQLTASGINLRSTQVCEVMHHPVLTISEQALHNIFAALFLFRRHHIRHLVIANDQQMIGVISPDSIRHILRPTNLLKIRRVAEVMTNQVTTASLGTSVLKLTELMAARQISCVVIVDELAQALGQARHADISQHPIGIVTERDIVRFQATGVNISTTPAQAIMSTPLFVLSPEDSLWTAHQAMEQQQVRRLVVSWNWGEKLGLVTQTSILRVFDPIEMHDVIETLQRTIQQLGLDLDKVLANAIDHDHHLPASLHHPEPDEIPNLKLCLNNLQIQIQHLVDYPELPSDARQAALLGALSELQQVQTLF